MTISKLNEIMSTKARNLGACDKVMSKWTTLLDERELIRLWLHNYEFAYKNDFPSIDDMKGYFPEYIRQQEGVFVDEYISLHNKNGIVATHGNTNGLMLYDSFSTATIYLRHKSDITISAKGMSILFIHVLDDAKVNVIQGDNSKVYIYQHSKNAYVEYEGKVELRTKYN